MTILKKGQTGKILVTAIAVIGVLAVVVPLVSAYESYAINVTARVEERFNTVKTIRLATDLEIQEAIDGGVTFPDGLFRPYPPDSLNVDFPNIVPTFTTVVWVATIGIFNPHDYAMTNVVVKDNFSAEVGGVPMDWAPVDLFIKTHSRGKGKKEPFETQYRITWYVTYEGPFPFPLDPEFDPAEFNTGVMLPGDSEFLELLVWTKENPSGKQEYTTKGFYTLNSGPTAKWFDAPPAEGGHQFSFDYEPVFIEAFDPPE